MSPVERKRRRQNRWVKAQRKQVALESELERRTVEFVERVLRLWAPKYGRRGWPDRLVLLGRGRHCWFEFKRAKFGSLTPAQRRVIPRLRESGEPVYVVRTWDETLSALKRELGRSMS